MCREVPESLPCSFFPFYIGSILSSFGLFWLIFIFYDQILAFYLQLDARVSQEFHQYLQIDITAHLAGEDIFWLYTFIHHIYIVPTCDLLQHLWERCFVKMKY